MGGPEVNRTPNVNPPQADKCQIKSEAQMTKRLEAKKLV